MCGVELLPSSGAVQARLNTSALQELPISVQSPIPTPHPVDGNVIAVIGKSRQKNLRLTAATFKSVLKTIID